MDETTEWLRKTKVQLTQAAETETSLVDLDGFKTALNPADGYFASRLFGLLSARHGGDLVPVDDLVRDLTDIAGSPIETRLRTLFDVYDENESGSIDAAEMRTMLAACASVGVLGPTDNVLDTITLSLFDDADKDGDGEISFDQFRDVLVAHAEILDNLAVSPESWLREASQVTLATDTASCTRRGKHYTDQQIGRVVFLVLYGIINVILFTLHAYKHRDTNAYIIVARGCGMCLNFNCAFIIVPVLSHDDDRDDHRYEYHHRHLYTSSTPTSGTNVTSAATTPTYWECLFTTRCGIGWIPGFGFAYLSGVLLWVPLLVIVAFSLPCIRRGGYFRVSYEVISGSLV
ncbi:hypothetical protein NP493_479g01039 [Ridgeia piscesae]|uniref:EF-hand domain-containing protein n=1 Tax=Ridgeia piscesae TaxID=27915 RepID=A0AAD9KYH3_RIDPI|nr:hypothetical protein NP493_479g01039 [Ridgeia piscesae]